jgi:hypothetical protein
MNFVFSFFTGSFGGVDYVYFLANERQKTDQGLLIDSSGT